MALSLVITSVDCASFYRNNCTGILACLDGYMNIAMEQTEEYVNGQLKNKYGDAFIRGNNGTMSLFSRYSVHPSNSVPFAFN